MPAAVALGLLLAFVFAQTGFAQADPPLTFAQNYLVRGDFVVAGAQGLTTNFDFNNGLAIGTITIPEPAANTGITGVRQIPQGGEVMAAVLYWQTVEKVGVMPGQPGSGQFGFFRPLIPGGPKAPGYLIKGVPLGGNNTVSWSSGGCTTGSTGKTVRTYRANVLGALPHDSNGVISANSANVTYEVRLPGTSSTTPIAVFATLVFVYRVLDSSVPLNFILIYDGDTATSATSLTMTQTLKHFYDAAHNPVSRLAHIVGNGKSKKTETVSLNGVTLPSLYPGQPPFPGFYGTGDNPVWTFGNPNVPAIPNPIQEDSDAATTQVMASGANPGCESWGAVILSTTVKNTDGDGLPDAVKTAPANYPNPGYCDADKVCTPGDPNWVDLPGAVLGTVLTPHPDVYVQLDYMCSSPNADGLTCKTGDGINYSFDPTLQIDAADGKHAVRKVKDVYASHGITLHVNEQGNQPNVHAIQEPYCQDTMVNGQLSLCTFPHPSNPPGNTINLGAVAWPGDVYDFERQLIDKDEPLNLSDCVSPVPQEDCVPRFQPAAALAKHYGLFAHAVGQPKWFIYNGSLVSATQSDNTVTFTTSMPVGALNVLVDEKGNSAPDPSCLNGRVTVIGAGTNPNLGGTHCITPVANPPNSFTIAVGGPPTNTQYTFATDPNLALVPPFTSTSSGVADVGGHHFVVSLGRWENPASPNSDGQNPLVIAGTLMHEGGHNLLSLAHGGPTKGAAANPLLFQFVTTNCKPNYFSVMSYSRQVDGVLDYSENALAGLDKTIQKGDLSGAGPATASWYVPFPVSFDAKGNPIGSPARLTCPGGPLPAPAVEGPMTRVTGPANTFSFAAAPDPNYDGNLAEDLQGACDWGPDCPGNFDLAQTGATAALASSSGNSFGGGGNSFGGGGNSFGGGGNSFGGGGNSFGGGGNSFGGGGEIDLATAESITHAITDLTVVSEGVSPRKITLKWSKPFGDIGAYNIYRSVNGVQSFTKIGTVQAPQTTFTDTPQGNGPPCNTSGYQYFVTAVQSATSPFPGDESTQGNIAKTILPDTTDPLTGCYTFTGFSSPAAGSSAVQGSIVPVTWSVKDDFYFTNNNPFVNNVNANTLVAIGPVSNDQVCGSVTANTPRTTIAQSGAGVMVSLGPKYLFTFNWNTTAFAAGCYLLKLDLDSGQPQFGGQPVSAFQVLIYLSDVSLQVTTTALPDGVVGSAYNKTLTETGGTTGGGQPFTWTVISGALPPGIALGLAPDGVSGALTGIPTVPGTYNFTVKVTDSIGDFGTQALTLVVDAVVTNTLDVGAGSLRQALLDVNAAQPGPQPLRILFNIPAPGVQTISPATPLPALIQPAIIDATTQPGWAGPPIIELNGSNAGAAAVNGIHIAAGSSTVHGLAINRFSGNGILLDTNGGDVVQGNYIGTDATGTVAQPNGGNGIQIVATPNNVVGGANVISGNSGEGVRIDGTLATNNAVVSNRIGTDATGSVAVGNSASGIYIRRAPGNSVAGNVVSGNLGFAGITICGIDPGGCGGGDVAGIDETSNAAGNTVVGNFIGTDGSGVNPLGNNQAGVSIDGAPNAQVGRTGASTANVISNNGTNDVQLFSPAASGNRIEGNTIQGKPNATTVGISEGIFASLPAGTGNTFTRNSISGHGGLGIDLAPAGINTNVAGGANNFPVITSAQVASGTISGTLNGPANATFTIEFFSNSGCNKSGNGEGAVFLGSRSVATDVTGNVMFAAPVTGLVAGNTITATSTDANGTTSEFSACVVAN
jgi:fibronectin type 3 domain-containing protein